MKFSNKVYDILKFIAQNGTASKEEIAEQVSE